MAMHATVLLDEAVDALMTRPDGRYIDGTFGRGGHSRAILTSLSNEGSLLGIDKDPQAIETASILEKEDTRFVIAQGSFADVRQFVGEKNLGLVDGILLDLGVSSPQLDQAERGFSFLRDGYLDMRMNPEQGQSAAQWLAGAPEGEIAKVLKEFGEERFAKRLARAIVKERLSAPIETTLHLAKVIADAHPAWEKGKNPATKSFQGIRIFINNELGDLSACLDQVLDVLAIGGRLVVISFHSLEDRLVKRFIKRHVRGDDLPASVPVTEEQLNRRLKQIGKTVRASVGEVDKNIRLRSAIMRVAQKIA
ncbi:MAG: 16S rRNA (cytosine(1402)-N(4))-methyltransferase RsmH [Spongiibacteraceae bacterium]|nr:16S rRNA (cytosine(1402)-N(4))-methyltransferase RsmH [Spongiibacteraceae bacterium]